MQCRAVARRCPLGSVTVLGDLAQATTPWAPGDWAGHPAPPRPPGAPVRAADRRLPRAGRGARRGQPAAAAHRAPTCRPRRSVRGRRRRPALRPAGSSSDAVRALPARVEGSVGVIVADARGAGVLAAACAAPASTAHAAATRTPTRGSTVVPASAAKGLEFDSVVLLEPAQIVAAEPSRLVGLRRLYVVLTRAVSRLVVLHDEPLPEELR